MKIKIYATLRDLAQTDVLDVPCQTGDRISDLLRAIVENWPILRPELLDENGELSSRIHLFINGRDVRYLDGVNMPVPEDADIRIFPPVGGGA